MIRNRYALVVGLIVCSQLPLAISAQAEETNANHSLGLSAGWVGGSGISYRHYLDSSFVQISAIATLDKAENKEYADGAMSYGYYISQHNLDDGLYPVATKFLIGIEAERKGEPNEATAADDKLITHKLYTGIGAGLDILSPRKKGLVVSMDLYYTATFLGLSSPDLQELEFLSNFGVHYNF